jgi:hypothetical protein
LAELIYTLSHNYYKVPEVVCGGTIFEAVGENTPIEQVALDLDEFIGWLRELQIRTLPEQPDPTAPNLPTGFIAKTGKIANCLICPSIFTTTRAIANVRETTGIWLDNDTGAMSHDEFASLFPTLRIIAFNTFSTTPDINKYRLFIPTDDTMGAQVYSHIVKEIIRQVAAVNPAPGFDLVPTHAAALFYLPCQAKEREASFFVDYNEAGRNPLNVESWREIAEKNQPEPVNYAFSITKVGENEKRHRVQQAVSKWRAACLTTQPHDGQDHTNFYRLGLTLVCWCGCDKPEAANILKAAAKYAHTPENRRRQIGSIFKSIHQELRGEYV